MSLYPIETGMTSSARQAALLLHAMHPSDREWAMERLAPGQRKQLEAWVHELEEIGIPRDKTLVEHVLVGIEAQSEAKGTPDAKEIEASGSAGARDFLYSIEASAISALVSVLRHEPPRLIAMLLAQTPWPWEHELLARLSQMKRRQVERFLSHYSRGQVPEMLGLSVTERVATRLRHLLEGESQQTRSSSMKPASGERLTGLRGLFSQLRKGRSLL